MVVTANPRRRSSEVSAPAVPAPAWATASTRGGPTTSTTRSQGFVLGHVVGEQGDACLEGVPARRGGGVAEEQWVVAHPHVDDLLADFHSVALQVERHRLGHAAANRDLHRNRVAGVHLGRGLDLRDRRVSQRRIGELDVVDLDVRSARLGGRSHRVSARLPSVRDHDDAPAVKKEPERRFYGRLDIGRTGPRRARSMRCQCRGRGGLRLRGGGESDDAAWPRAVGASYRAHPGVLGGLHIGVDARGAVDHEHRLRTRTREYLRLCEREPEQRQSTPMQPGPQTAVGGGGSTEADMDRERRERQRNQRHQ